MFNTFVESIVCLTKQGTAHSEKNERGPCGMGKAQIEVVQSGNRKYIGTAVTSPLNNVQGVGEAHRLFMERRGEIQNQVDEHAYVCVHFANEVLFTYIYCMEVTELQRIPAGMIGFEVPGGSYVFQRRRTLWAYPKVYAGKRDAAEYEDGLLRTVPVRTRGKQISCGNMGSCCRLTPCVRQPFLTAGCRMFIVSRTA